MPKAGDEFDSFFEDHACSVRQVSKITYRYRANRRTVDPVKIVTRQIKSVEARFSGDPWQPVQWIYHYGDETTWTA